MDSKIKFYKKEIDISDLTPEFLSICNTSISKIKIVSDIEKFEEENLSNNTMISNQDFFARYPKRFLVWDSDCDDIYYFERLEIIDLSFNETDQLQWLFNEITIEDYLKMKTYLRDSELNFITIDNCDSDIYLSFDNKKLYTEAIYKRVEDNIDPYKNNSYTRIPQLIYDADGKLIKPKSPNDDPNVFHKIVKSGPIYKIFFIVDKDSSLTEPLDEIRIYDLTIIPKHN